MNEWISLDERWPDEGQQVKLKMEDDSECWAVRGSKPCSHCWFSPFGGQLLISPTHWHSIPEEEKIDTSIKIDMMAEDLYQEFKQKKDNETD